MTKREGLLLCQIMDAGIAGIWTLIYMAKELLLSADISTVVVQEE